MREIVKFERDELEDELFGYVISESHELVLIASECDLIIDGYKVFRKSSVSLQETDEATQFSTKILDQEALVNQLDFDLKLSLESISACLKDLVNQWVLLEDEENVLIGLGKLVEVGTAGLRLRPFDGAGSFDEDEMISLDDIFTVSFATRYLELNSKYSQ